MDVTKRVTRRCVRRGSDAEVSHCLADRRAFISSEIDCRRAHHWLTVTSPVPSDALTVIFTQLSCCPTADPSWLPARCPRSSAGGVALVQERLRPDDVLRAGERQFEIPGAEVTDRPDVAREVGFG